MVDHLIIKKEKKLDFFEWAQALDKKATDFWKDLPFKQWIPFKSIPQDIFHFIFTKIDESPNVLVDKEYNEFMICH
jgi:hypothetical protein